MNKENIAVNAVRRIPTFTEAELANEIWKSVPTEPGYGASSLGRIRNDRTGRILTPCPANREGHVHVRISNHNRYVHHLVAEAFHGVKPAGMIVLHWDDDPTNNRLRNVHYGTYKDNCLDRLFNRNPSHVQRYVRGADPVEDAFVDDIASLVVIGDDGRFRPLALA